MTQFKVTKPVGREFWGGFTPEDLRFEIEIKSPDEYESQDRGKHWANHKKFILSALEQLLDRIEDHARTMPGEYQQTHASDMFQLEFNAASIGSGPECEYSLKYISSMEEDEVYFITGIDEGAEEDYVEN